MLRGTKKQIIHLKHPESPLFEEAFLIVKTHPPVPLRPTTMVEEANRLLAEQDTPTPLPPSRAHHSRFFEAVLSFVGGVLTGVAVLTVLCLWL